MWRLGRLIIRSPAMAPSLSALYLSTTSKYATSDFLVVRERRSTSPTNPAALSNCAICSFTFENGTDTRSWPTACAFLILLSMSEMGSIVGSIDYQDDLR